MVVYGLCVLIMVGGLSAVNTIHAEEAVVQPRGLCLECEAMAGSIDMCKPETRTYAGTREHSYGFLWTKTCTVTSYEAQGANTCAWCGHELPFLDADQSDGLARHLCVEIHSECGAGDDGYYLVCPFQQPSY